MTETTLGQAFAYARHGWPVFPCLPGQKIPATRHGFRDATTDEQQITAWFSRGSGWNLSWTARSRSIRSSGSRPVNQASPASPLTAGLGV
jgi:Bifunctional DNA primase/polymerase, N-terminal